MAAKHGGSDLIARFPGPAMTRSAPPPYSPHRLRPLARALGLALFSVPAGVALASDLSDPTDLDGLQVSFVRGEQKVGLATAASEGAVGGNDLVVRPLLKVAELLEAVPGFVAAQHSGSGKANQYFLRGFNLDHGSDFATYVDEVPVNLRSHGHGQGYLDINGFIPEALERIDYRKGPYRVDGGDFALAGAAALATVGRLDRRWVGVEAGSHGWRRLAAGGSFDAPAGAVLTVLGQWRGYDGPWQQPEALDHRSAFAKYRRPTDAGALELGLHTYHATWNPTEQIPERAIGTPVCADVYCSPDPTAHGRTTRHILNARLAGEDWRANAYIQHYDWAMYSNPTFAGESGASAQILQLDRRQVYGGSARRQWRQGQALELEAGVELRHDAIGRVGVLHTDRRELVESLGLYAVDESSLGAWGQATWRPWPRLRIVAGVRGDYYGFDVAARDAAAQDLGTGSGHDGIASPRLALAWQLRPGLELYANAGDGFHSNDVRGVVNTRDPVPALVRGRGHEAGLRYERGGFSTTATWWALDVDSELRFVGDSNAVEPTDASRRHGYELVAFWRPRPWLALDLSWTASNSRYRTGEYIPNAFENAGQLGISAVRGNWEASLRWRHLGDYPLLEDNSERAAGSDVVNLRAAWKQPRYEVYAELLNALDSHDKDISYYYESFLPGVDAQPVEGRLGRVVEPRSLRLGLRWVF